MGSEKLRACPFCGHWVQFARDIFQEINGVYCPGCKASIKWPIYHTKEETFAQTEERWLQHYNREANDGGIQSGAVE